MTRQQERMLERIKRKCEDSLFFGGPEKYEFKQWEVKDYRSFVSLVFETGRKGDEGTMAAIFARDRAHLFIGPRGGVTYPVSRKLKNGEYRHSERRWNGVSILTPVIDQRI